MRLTPRQLVCLAALLEGIDDVNGVLLERTGAGRAVVVLEPSGERFEWEPKAVDGKGVWKRA